MKGKRPERTRDKPVTNRDLELSSHVMFLGFLFGRFGFGSTLHLHVQVFFRVMAVKEEVPFVAPQSTDPYMVGFVREAMDAATPGESHAQRV